MTKQTLIGGIVHKLQTQLILSGIEKTKLERFVAACEKIISDSLGEEKERVEGVVDLDDV